MWSTPKYNIRNTPYIMWSIAFYIIMCKQSSLLTYRHYTSKWYIPYTEHYICIWFVGFVI